MGLVEGSAAEKTPRTTSATAGEMGSRINMQAIVPQNWLCESVWKVGNRTATYSLYSCSNVQQPVSPW
jgi:hypothetical protein